MSDNVRPFEVGNMVVVRDDRPCGIGKRIGYIYAVHEHRIVVEIGQWTMKSYVKSTLRCTDNKNSDAHKIVCIRSKQKGSKEARDIVAKLTWLYLAQLRKCKKNNRRVYELWKGRDSRMLPYVELAVDYENLNTFHTAREVAKSMLKEDL